MRPTAIRNLQTFFTPSLVEISQISNHMELLLSGVVPDFFAANQAIFTHSKLIIINQSESNLSIEDVRKMIETLSFGSLNGEIQAVLLSHIEQASIPAQNALLKILEEPPPQIKFFLTTTSKEAVLETILSRCEVTSVVNDIKNNDIDIERMGEAERVWEAIGKNSIRENIELAETYQNKQEAINILSNILKIAHLKLEEVTQNGEKRSKKVEQGEGQSLGTASTSQQPQLTAANQQAQLVAACKTVITAIGQLQQNVSVKLALVECFMKLRKTI